MLYTDTTNGSNIAKDPAVVRFEGKYYMYYSTHFSDDFGKEQWGIGIAVSSDLEEWTKIGDIDPDGDLEKNGICAPGAMVYEGSVHLFFRLMVILKRMLSVMQFRKMVVLL